MKVRPKGRLCFRQPRLIVWRLAAGPRPGGHASPLRRRIPREPRKSEMCCPNRAMRCRCHSIQRRVQQAGQKDFSLRHPGLKGGSAPHSRISRGNFTSPRRDISIYPYQGEPGGKFRGAVGVKGEPPWGSDVFRLRRPLHHPSGGPPPPASWGRFFRPAGSASPPLR